MSKNNRPLDDDFDGYGGNDYALYQVTPRLSPKRVFIKVKKEYTSKRAEIEKLLKKQQYPIVTYFSHSLTEEIYKVNNLDKISDYIGLISLGDAPAYPESKREQIDFPDFEEEDLCIYKDYKKVHSAIKSIASYVEDCRFFIGSCNDPAYDQWIDEYTIADGKLTYIQDEYDEEIDTDYFKERLGKKKDEALKSFISFLEGEKGKQASYYDDEEYEEDEEENEDEDDYEKGDELLLQGKFMEAEPYFRKYVDTYRIATVDDTYAGILTSFSETYTAEKNHTKALLYAEIATTVNDQSIYALAAKGNALSNVGQYKEALSCFEKALKLNQKYYYPYYCKACVLALMKGNKSEIFQSLEKAISLYPEIKNSIKKDADFKSLKNDPEFKKLITLAV